MDLCDGCIMILMRTKSGLFWVVFDPRCLDKSVDKFVYSGVIFGWCVGVVMLRSVS